MSNPYRPDQNTLSLANGAEYNSSTSANEFELLSNKLSSVHLIALYWLIDSRLLSSSTDKTPYQHSKDSWGDQSFYWPGLNIWKETKFNTFLCRSWESLWSWRVIQQFGEGRREQLHSSSSCSPPAQRDAYQDEGKKGLTVSWLNAPRSSWAQRLAASSFSTEYWCNLD